MYYKADPVHMDSDGQWYFYTPDLLSRFGPYVDQALAYTKVNKFIQFLNSQGPQPAAPAANAQVDELMARTITVRDEIEKIKARHAKELEVPQAELARCEGGLLGFLNAHNMDSVSTNLGTAYTQTAFRCAIGDKGALTEHIRTHGDVDLLQTRISSTNVKAWMEAHPGEHIPGVKIDYVREVRIRRK